MTPWASPETQAAQGGRLSQEKPIFLLVWRLWYYVSEFFCMERLSVRLLQQSPFLHWSVCVRGSLHWNAPQLFPSQQYQSRTTCKKSTWGLWTFRGLKLDFSLYDSSYHRDWGEVGDIFFPSFFPIWILYRSGVNLAQYSHPIIPQRSITLSTVQSVILFWLHLILGPNV